jgi:RimJ/RimL family protein N-acetyltransferase
MGWTLTSDPEEFAARAGELLRADPVRHTLPLTLLETLRAAGPSAFGDHAPVYGWHQASEGAADRAADGAADATADNTADGAFLQTPPFPVLVGALPADGAAEFVATFTAEHGVPHAINVSGADEAAFLAAWADVTGGTAGVGTRSRLFRLGELTPPDPAPAGAARVATAADRDLVLAWLEAFHAEASPESPANVTRTLDDRLTRGGFTLWEAGGKPVALAGRTQAVAGVVRVAPVYTPPEHRRRSYGGAVTTAVTQAALDEGAEAVVLFTDQANPTSNALYQRLGYRPVEDRVVLNLRPDPAERRDVTSADGTSSERS